MRRKKHIFIGILLFIVMSVTCFPANALAEESYVVIGSMSSYSFDTAKTIDSGTLYYREYSSDWHSRMNYNKFTLEKDGYIYLSTTTKYHYDIKLYNETRNLVYDLGSQRDFAGYLGLGAGTYYIVLNNSGYSNNYFYMSFDITYYENIEKEPNDTFSDAQKIEYDKEYLLLTGYNFNNEDNFSFDGYENTNLRITVGNYETAKPHIYLYGSDRTIYKTVVLKYDELLDTYYYECNLSKTGTYYIKTMSSEKNQFYFLSLKKTCVVHTYGTNSTTIKKPTCIESGIERKTCSICHASEDVIINALGHTIKTSTVPATTEKEGKKIKLCTVCNKVLKETTIPRIPKPKSTSIKTLKASKKAMTVTVKKVSKVNGYQAQYSTDKKLMKSVKSATIKSSKTSISIKKLKSKNTYYVRVRTYKMINGKKIYSNWSKVKKVKVK